MKIYSTFKDYYDTAHGGWYDDAIKYNRKTEIINDNDIYNIKKECSFICNNHKFSNRLDKIDKYLNFFIIGFCGKTYILYNKIVSTIDGIISNEFFYDDILNRYAADYSVKYFFSNYQMNRLSDILNKFDNIENDKFFLKHRTPIYLIDLTNNKSEIIINSDLKKYQFFKVKDSYTAFNDIAMYLSNTLVSDTEIKEVDDKTKIISKGFDLKSSFRNV